MDSSNSTYWNALSKASPPYGVLSIWHWFYLIIPHLMSVGKFNTRSIPEGVGFLFSEIPQIDISVTIQGPRLTVMAVEGGEFILLGGFVVGDGTSQRRAPENGRLTGGI